VVLGAALHAAARIETLSHAARRCFTITLGSIDRQRVQDRIELRAQLTTESDPVARSASATPQLMAASATGGSQSL
jgi:hypothetical protein